MAPNSPHSFKSPRWRKRRFIRIYLPTFAVLVVVALVVTLSVTLTRSASCPPVIPTGLIGPEVMKGIIPNNNKVQTLDPTLIRRASDNKLFLYTTAKNGSVWTATSLYGPWKHEGSAGFPEYGGAPSIHMVGNSYYVYFNNHQFDYASLGVHDKQAKSWHHGACILAASSKTLEVGNWTQPERLDIPWQAKYNILDAQLITVASEPGEQNLLTFGSYNQGLHQLPLADPPTKIADGATDSITQLANNVTKSFPDGGPLEAGFIFKWEDWYYLFFSSGRCCRQQGTDNTWMDPGNVYKVMVCRSKDPRTDYVDDQGRSCAEENGGKEILGSHDDIWAPGAQGVMTDYEAGGPLMYYHYVPYDTKTRMPKKKYQFGWNKLSFDSGWPVIVQ